MLFVVRTICVFCIFRKGKHPRSWLSFWHASSFGTPPEWEARMKKSNANPWLSALFQKIVFQLSSSARAILPNFMQGMALFNELFSFQNRLVLLCDNDL